MIERLEKHEVEPGLVDDSIKAAFGGSKGKDFYRYDFMYVAHKNSIPEAFVLCREISAETVEFSYGGSVPEARGYSTLKNFHDFLGDVSKHYKYAVAWVENKNFPMLKVCNALKFEIIGVRRNPEGRIFVEHFKELKGD